MTNFLDEEQIRRSFHWWLIGSVLLYVMLAVAVYSYYGVRLVNDSPRYLGYAERIQEGFYVARHNIWYIGYVFFVFSVQLITQSQDPIWIVLAQYALGLLGLLALIDAGRRLHNSHRAGLSAGLMYLAFIELIFWHSYILCESFYVSIVCCILWSVIRWQQDKTVAATVFMLLLLGLGVFVKPTGIAFLVASMIALAHWLWPRMNRGLRWAVGVSAILSTLILADTMLATFLIMENYQKGEVIYAIRTLPYKEAYKFLVLDAPADLYTPQSESPLLRIASFAIGNFGYWTKLLSLKVFFYIFHIRPYWSAGHNLFTLLLLLPIYALSLRALWLRHLPVWFLVMAVSFVLTHVISVGLTSVDWDGRFLMPVLPVFFLLSASTFRGNQ